MLVAVQSSTDVCFSALPENVGGAHWICDAAGRALVSAEDAGGAWSLVAAEGLEAHGAETRDGDRAVVHPGHRAVVNVSDGARGRWVLVFYPEGAGALQTEVYGFVGDRDLTVGRDDSNTVRYANPFVSAEHLRLSHVQGAWTVVDLGAPNGVFVNGRKLDAHGSMRLGYGDSVTVLGLRITVGAGFFACNDPDGEVRVDTEGLVVYRPPRIDDEAPSELPDRLRFYPALRLARSVERKSFQIDAPPQPEREDDTPLAMRIGPSLVMAFASVFSALVMVMMMADQNGSMLRAVPMLFMAVAMLCGSVLWPVLNTRFQTRKRQAKESQRRASYSQYLNNARLELKREEDLQREVLMENRIGVRECIDRAVNRDASLMDRTPLHKDYLELRMGSGEEPFQADIRFPDAHFTVEEDELREAVDVLAREPRVLGDVPLAISLVQSRILGVVGQPEDTVPYVRGLLVQVATLFSYENVQIVVMCDEGQRDEWAFASYLPHCFTPDKGMRYFACGSAECDGLGMQLERVFEARRQVERFDAREALPYYVVVCASDSLLERASIVKAISEERENLGVSLVAVSQAMRNLPKECSSVIELAGDEGTYVERDDPARKLRTFDADIKVDRDTADLFASSISAIRLDLEVENRKIPSRLGFLEMCGIGDIGRLNLVSSWRASNASASLACQVGVDANGEPFLLNLHEKSHGPHGLIAGTTGSGKSEFIITYILSMAMTYSPDDVAFVLIDYKGGGLAKAFDNEHVRLPHLAGVITNLDGAAITRSLVSIKSELKRRQALFNQARDVAGGDNVDIYSYLDLYRQGKVTEACPHLFIVADEFAELKQQEPEFMDELISAARIGRSLGVHLVLATQKPTGVVNDQIWSNARFKVCLKVADAADSNEMIRRPDAAEISEAGRFFLLVGYNEFFAMGQSGYSGGKYVARERFEESRDDAVVLVSNNGSPLVTMSPQRDRGAEGTQSEAVTVLRCVERAADEIGVRARQLWLEPVPALVRVDDLVAKYGQPQSAPGSLCPVVGEFDDPDNQLQHQLALPLSAEGNVLVYGTPESGVELVLNSLVYSLLHTYDASVLNVYVLDFGSESMKAFSAAPQVGDVVCTGEDEKVARFFDFIDAEMLDRRKRFAEYGGSFERYAQTNDDKAAIVVVVNDCAAFMELYPQLEDRLARLTRESGRGGVHLVMTAAGSSSVRVRMRQGFRQVLAVNLVDETDYSMIFGSMRGVPVPKGFGRGLVKTDDGVFEFQAAHVGDGGDEFGVVVRFCQQLAERDGQGASAPEIPTSPEHVSIAEVASMRATGPFVPFGVYDDTLRVAGFDFGDAPLARCLFQRRKDGSSFVRAFLEANAGRDGWELACIDFAQILGSEKPEGLVFATRKDEFAKSWLRQVLDNGPRAAGEPQLLVVVSGLLDYINRNGQDFETGENFGEDLRTYLRSLRPEDGVRFLLVDSSSDTSYMYEDWFKAHLTNKDGLWVGPGIDGQSSISTAYNARFASDAVMRNAKGYQVEGGDARLVHLVGLPKEEGEDE